MASKAARYSHDSGKRHVKFQDNNDATAPVTEINTIMRNYDQASTKTNRNNGPLFPTLQSYFKNKSVHSGYDETKVSTSVPSSETNSTTASMLIKEEDINLEATEFIKRRHQNLDLQKFMSMKMKLAT